MASSRSLCIALVLAGCSQPGGGSSWSEVASAADEASLVLASEMALLVVPGNLAPAATPEETAAAAVDAAGDAFDPPTCVTATANGADVSYVLDDCTGSFGLVRATGLLEVTFRAGEAGTSAFTARASDLTLREGHVSFEVEATVVREGLTRTIEATTTSSGESPSGRAFERTGTVTARWMDNWGCLFVDHATLDTELMDRAWSTEIEALTYCIGECPMGGGSVRFDEEGESAIRLDYGGYPTVRWSVDDASTTSGDLAIACGV